MLHEEFTKVETEEIEGILSHVNPTLGDQAYSADNTTIMMADLSFYHGYVLLEISDHSVHPLRRHYVVYNETDGTHHIVDYTNEFIYGLNKSIPLMLDDINVFEYLRFFFAHVAGAHGRFLVIENIDDIAWRENPPPNAREVISKMIEPLTLLEAKKDGSYLVNAFMVFKTGLFKAKITITSDGTVNMGNEEMLIEDMPILDDVIGY